MANEAADSPSATSADHQARPGLPPGNLVVKCTNCKEMLIASASGGARMQEGLYSLMQMAKTSVALAKLGEAKIPYFSLLTDPTTGGVTASFAMLGDVILAEPGALVCFTGPRVIEQFMHVKPPEINSEFVLLHGMIDAVVHRRDLRQTLAQLPRPYSPCTPEK